MTAPASKFWDIAKDALCILVIPLLVWGVRLEVRLAVQEQSIQENKKISAQASKLADAVQVQAIQLAKLDGRVEAIHERLKEIRDLVSSTNP